MEISYVSNLGEVGKTLYQNIDTFPFLRKSIESYVISEYDFGLSDFHSCKIVWMRTFDKWYCYFYAVDTLNVPGIFIAEATNPSGEWTLVKDGNDNPVRVQPTGEEDFEKAGTYIGGLCVVQYAGSYRGWYQYTDNDNNKRCAWCKSTDGKTWTDKTPCIFDSTITSIFNGGYLSITDVTYDWVSKKYIGLIHASINALMCCVASSSDGISWTLVSIPNILNLNTPSGEAFDAFALERFGNIWVIMAHRYDRTEGTLIKNDVFAVSADLNNWETIVHPMLGVNAECVKYPCIRQAINSIYFVFVSGYGNGSTSKLCFGRMEHSQNPPIEKHYDSLVYNTPTSLKYYGNGDVNARIEVKATVSDSAQIKVDVYPVFTDNQRLIFIEGATPCYTKTLEFIQGTDIILTEEFLLPHLYDIQLTNISNNSTVENVEMNICFKN